MKKLFFLIFLVYLSDTSFGQITITKNDMPKAKDTARYSTTSTNLNFTNTGPNYTWNFSSLVANGQGVDTFKSALTLDPLFALYFGLTDIAVPSSNDLDFSALSLTNELDFYSTSNSYFEINGLSADYSGVPLPFSYTIPDKVYQFPLTYPNATTSPFDVSISVPGVAGVHQVGTRTNTVDGWGTVITPYDTFQCIRLKSVHSEVDSIDLTAVGLSIGVPVPTVTYKWLANGVIIPVLEVDGFDVGGTFVPTSEKFRDGVRFIPPQFNITITFTANKNICTTDDTVTITSTVSHSGVAGTVYQYTITPNTFSYVSGTDSTSASPQMRFNAPGLYTVSLYTAVPAGGSVPATATLTKPNYIYVTYPTGIRNVQGDNIIHVYPNPANDHISCQLNGNGNKQATIDLEDMAGRVLYTLTTSQNGVINIPTAQIGAGEYVFRVTPEGENAYTQKVTIVH